MEYVNSLPAEFDQLLKKADGLYLDGKFPAGLYIIIKSLYQLSQSYSTTLHPRCREAALKIISSIDNIINNAQPNLQENVKSVIEDAIKISSDFFKK